MFDNYFDRFEFVPYNRGLCVWWDSEMGSHFKIRHSAIQVPKELFKQNDILDIKTTVQA